MGIYSTSGEKKEKLDYVGFYKELKEIIIEMAKNEKMKEEEKCRKQ